MAKVTQSKFSAEKKERLAEIVKQNRKRNQRMLKLYKSAKKEADNPGYYAGARGTVGSTGAHAQLLQGIPKIAKKGWRK